MNDKVAKDYLFASLRRDNSAGWAPVLVGGEVVDKVYEQDKGLFRWPHRIGEFVRCDFEHNGYAACYYERRPA